MSEQELIRALQELVARHTPSPEPCQTSSEIIWRDRWRVGLLAGVTALLWLVGIAGVLYMVFCFNRFIIAYSGADPEDLKALYADRESARKAWEFDTKMDLHHSLETCLAAVPALLLAALGTVWLVLSSRRATLNQINLSLEGISKQLREMRAGRQGTG